MGNIYNSENILLVSATELNLVCVTRARGFTSFYKNFFFLKCCKNIDCDAPCLVALASAFLWAFVYFIWEFVS